MRGNPAIIIVSFIICTLSFQYSFAQQKFNYDKEWKNVDSLIRIDGSENIVVPTEGSTKRNEIVLLIIHIQDTGFVIFQPLKLWDEFTFYF